MLYYANKTFFLFARYVRVCVLGKGNEWKGFVTENPFDLELGFSTFSFSLLLFSL